jgi:hypothetical protein
VGDGNNLEWLPVGAVDDEIGACRPEQQSGVVGEEIRPLVAQPRERCQAVEVLVERVNEPIGGLAVRSRYEKTWPSVVISLRLLMPFPEFLRSVIL